MLGNVQIKTPLVSINYEAREIAVKWACTKGFVVQKIEGYPIFSCPFNPGRDILYIPPNEELTFLKEPFDKRNEAALVNQDPLRRTFVRNFAIMESALEDDRSFLCRIYEYFSPIGMLVIIIKTPPGTGFADSLTLVVSVYRSVWGDYIVPSCCWSDALSAETLKFGGYKMPITSTFYNALVSFQKQGMLKDDYRLRVDRVCKNQDSMEPGEEVIIMSEMYKRAWKVVAQLSPGQKD
ncbi:hypothetical protein BPAE_0249g00110 [Botrytis paeoniae]|uniref:Heterokaryon incompatibility domain-containing protein n=1 Tax=Botrytis paeoniae TaxID=278948 RepID=A0A4Z1F889_9HELO|nr:hypothetical protein BPAE_0249g00110 [Botrytis paeoniae]